MVSIVVLIGYYCQGRIFNIETIDLPPILLNGCSECAYSDEPLGVRDLVKKIERKVALVFKYTEEKHNLISKNRILKR